MTNKRSAMVIPFQLHGYAICSEDDFIADNYDRIPPALNFAEDKAYFRRELDRASLIIMGSTAHNIFPNDKFQKRLVLTSKVDGLTCPTNADNTHFLNPRKQSLQETLQKLVPHGGRIAVPGGAHVIEACWEIGFSCFHLTRVKNLFLKTGKKLFLDCEKGLSADAVLRAHGLTLREKRPFESILLLSSFKNSSAAKSGAAGALLELCLYA